MQCQIISNNNFFALQSDASSQTNELQLLSGITAFTGMYKNIGDALLKRDTNF